MPIDECTKTAFQRRFSGHGQREVRVDDRDRAQSRLRRRRHRLLEAVRALREDGLHRAGARVCAARLPRRDRACYNPNDAVGLDGALGRLAHNSYGPYLLGAVAAGFFAFAVFSLSEARYRRI
jgi:hypothetical protein